MTRKQRMLAAVRREPVDRVPFATYNFHSYGENQHTKDATYADLLAKVEAVAGAAIKIPGGSAGFVPKRLLERVEEGNGDERTQREIIHTPKGDLESVTRIPVDKPPMTTKHFVAGDDDIEKYLSLPFEPTEPDLARVRQVYETSGDRAMIMVTYAEPMFATANLFDFQDFCIRCVTDMPSIMRIINWSYERSEDYIRKLVKACRGMDVVLHTSGPEICTPPMLPPSLFAQLVTPHMKKLIGIIHDGGLLAAIHCHGHVREVLPEMIETGADLLEPIEPPDQGNIGIEELMKQSDGRMCVMGHIQDQEFYTAPPGHMRQKVEEIAAIVDGRTGYIMSPTCTPFEHPCSETYQRNYMEWLEAADRILGGGDRQAG